MQRILSEAEKAKMRERYANLTPEQRKAEGDRMQELRRIHRSSVRENHTKNELARREVFLRQLEQIEVAWAAGFWEGEGSVATRSFTACQKTRWPLEKLMVTFGGGISGPRASDGTFQWHICGEQARAFRAAITRYLSPRRLAQIDRVFLGQPKLGMPSHYKPILSVVKVANATDR